MRGAQVAELGRNVGGVVRRSDPGSPANIAPEAWDRLVDRRMLDVSRGDSGFRQRATNGRSEDLGHGRVTHEPLLIGVRLGMFARGVHVHEIVREARPAEKLRRALLLDQGRSACVPLPKMLRGAGAARPPLAGRDEGRARADQRV